MNWKLWFARDSFLWWACFWLGTIATALAVLTDPSWYGLPVSWMPYIRLVALVAAIVGGKMGMSPVPLKANLPTVGK